jgi:signal peptidase II
MIDRLTRGCVVDLFDFHWGIHHFPCFNVADAYITLSVGLLLAAGFFRKDEGASRDPA